MAFIHIPKCAGTAITNQLWLGKNSMSSNQIRHLHPKADKHSTAALMRVALKNHFPHSLLFAAVRDPYARAVSMWRQYIGVHARYLELNLENNAYDDHNLIVVKRYSRGKVGFRRFLKERPPWNWHPKNYHLPKDCPWDGWWPQTKWVCSKDSQVIVDHIFRVDDLKAMEDWLTKYNIRFIADMQANVRVNTDPMKMYDADLISIVNKVFYDDFELFGFERR